MTKVLFFEALRQISTIFDINDRLHLNADVCPRPIILQGEAMKSILLSLALVAVSHYAFAAEDPRITTGKVAELTTHRIDRLVNLKKIDAQFLHRLEKIEITKVDETPVAYKAIVSQTAPAQGKAIQLELTFDKDGKFINFKTIEGGVTGVDPLWNSADSVTLLENAMHFVLEHTSDSQVEPYFLSMTNATLSKTTFHGETVAVAQFKTSAQAQTLNVYVKLDGKFISHEIVP